MVNYNILNLIPLVFFLDIKKSVVYKILEIFDDRLSDTSKETIAKISKHGQHRLGQGFYSRL